MKKTTIREATEKWLQEFYQVPGKKKKKMAAADEMIRCYDSDSFRLIASPRLECGHCSATYDGDLNIVDVLKKAQGESQAVPCSCCTGNDGRYWLAGLPEYAFPCGWGTLFAPRNGLDRDWILENKQDVAKLGFYVFESEDFGVLLGIDAGGFDFYEAFWMPLYKLRGLKWHDT